ncbi:BBSome-interacting protein 1 [Scaptodrosophila lebanonensis]|uniref:BBSome-interacting protein 1 n=1 Tax=Drosophila lebanonensis TaxID=7225 RepID=A0A6J2TID6_DROLE|nr:BBSome-interacting protein 1 [Scaptodrosophila lebanonensis]
MSAVEQELLGKVKERIDLIEPTTGKLFFEHKDELVFCKPHLLPLKSQALERLEAMHRETARHLQKKRTTRNSTDNTNKAGGSE